MAVLGGVMAQRRSVEVAFAYVLALSPGVRANCWSLAEAAGHEGWGRMQALLRSYAWDWKDLRAELPGLAAAAGRPRRRPDRAPDRDRRDRAFEEGGCHGVRGSPACRVHRESGELRDHRVLRLRHRRRARLGRFDVYMPERWADDLPRRRAAGIPEDLKFATKPQLAIDQVGRLAAVLPLAWVAADEVYGRSGDLRKA